MTKFISRITQPTSFLVTEVQNYMISKIKTFKSKSKPKIFWKTKHMLSSKAYSSSWLRNLASLLVTTTSNWAARSTISFLLRVDTLCAISAQYVLKPFSSSTITNQQIVILMCIWSALLVYNKRVQTYNDILMNGSIQVCFHL